MIRFNQSQGCFSSFYHLRLILKTILFLKRYRFARFWRAPRPNQYTTKEYHTKVIYPNHLWTYVSFGLQFYSDGRSLLSKVFWRITQRHVRWIRGFSSKESVALNLLMGKWFAQTKGRRSKSSLLKLFTMANYLYHISRQNQIFKVYGKQAHL